MNKINTVAIILKPAVLKDFNEFLLKLSSWLASKKISIIFHDHEKERVISILGNKVKYDFCPEAVILSKVDLIITLGGDGTLIGTCRNVTKFSAPIMGINMGRLGFTTEFKESEAIENLEEIITGKFTTTQIPLFAITLFSGEKKIYKGHFINDVVVGRGKISRVFSVRVDCNNSHIYDVTGDGVIVSSPIGSTAYSLSAGGPLIHPDTNSMVVTPICPHSLVRRPIVLPDNATINLSIIDEIATSLSIDGQHEIQLTTGDVITITKEYSKHATLIKNTKKNYFSTLSEKFGFGFRER